MKHFVVLVVALVFGFANVSLAQVPEETFQWTKDGSGYFDIKKGALTFFDPAKGTESVIVDAVTLKNITGEIDSYKFSDDNKKVLFFANTARVWRYNTRGDYWLIDLSTKEIHQIGKALPAQSLKFAKLSPDAQNVAFVSDNNLYVENITTGRLKQLTFDGTRKLINGTFDWVYEEEFNCRDGFRWSPDGAAIAYWQVDATQIRDYYMLNTTDSVYSRVIPVEYPKVGEDPSPARIGVVNINTGNNVWMNLQGNPRQQYIVRMEWADAKRIAVQQLDRRQLETNLSYCDVATGQSHVFYTEKSNAWIETKDYWNDDNPTGWDWLNKGNDFLWVSEKDGWRHIYRVKSDGTKVTLLTKGNFDIGTIKCIDEKSNYVYFTASPDNPTQLYLYRVRLDGKGKAELMTPKEFAGYNDYEMSPAGTFAYHVYSSATTYPVKHFVSLPAHAHIGAKPYELKKNKDLHIVYSTIKIESGVELDAWVSYPKNFDSTKKYPVVFYVYGEPGRTTVLDKYNQQRNYMYDGDLTGDGYFYVSVDNRGTPMLKGAAWRKSIYRKIGRLNISDIANGAKILLEKSYFDKERVAVWGWSGGGSTTLHLLCQYPEIFKTGISIAALDNLLSYDNIYEERYMGLPQENHEDYVLGSATNYAKNLQGNLLLIHGTGDDNVHYCNAEMMLNELIKYNKQFQFMSYPNRTHAISEGEGTWKHLTTLYSNYLRKNCPPGAK